MVTERRPRIAVEIAEKIDTLRDGISFEAYIHDVLERHVEHNLGTPDDSYMRSRHGERRHTYTDVEDNVLYVDRDSGEGHTHEGIIASLVVSSEDFEAVGIYLDEGGLRGLRDVITELLGEWEHPR